MPSRISRVIIHPTDFSAVSHRAFCQALAIALQGQSKLFVVHVGPKLNAEVDWEAFPGVRATLARWGLVAADVPRKQIAEQFGLTVQKVVRRSSNPARATAELVDEHDADLVVVGSKHAKGRQVLPRRSIANAIARKSRARTLIVPERATNGVVNQNDGSGLIRRILVPVSRQPDGEVAITQAETFAKGLGESPASLKLFHVGNRGLPNTLPSEDRYCQWKGETRQGNVGQEIVREVQQFRADLIVMTTNPRRKPFKTFSGRTLTHTVRHARCPVLAVPG
ncbi:MAG: universal stress protein [Gammaproteobacteria bacterium]